jgi:hypothetical protein
MGLFPIAGAAKKAKKSKASKSSDMMSPSMPDHDYRSESDYRTLSDAEDIRSDKARFGGAKKHATKQLSKARAMFGGRR